MDLKDGEANFVILAAVQDGVRTVLDMELVTAQQESARAMKNGVVLVVNNQIAPELQIVMEMEIASKLTCLIVNVTKGGWDLHAKYHANTAMCEKQQMVSLYVNATRVTVAYLVIQSVLEKVIAPTVLVIAASMDGEDRLVKLKVVQDGIKIVLVMDHVSALLESACVDQDGEEGAAKYLNAQAEETVAGMVFVTVCIMIHLFVSPVTVVTWELTVGCHACMEMSLKC